METEALIAILAFAGVLISVLVGSKGQKMLDRRNHRNNSHPVGPCEFDQKAWDDLWKQEREWRDKLWDKHDFLEEEIKDNRRLLRDKFEALTIGLHDVVDIIKDLKSDLVNAIDRSR